MRDVEDERGDIVEEEDSSSPGKISAEQEAVDWCFHLKDASLAYNYTQFKIASTPCTYAIITATALTAYLLFYWTLVLTQHPDSFTISTAVITFIFAVIPLWVICAMRLQFLTSHEESEQPKHSRIGVWLRYLESFTALGFILAFSLMHIMRVSYGGCHATDYLHVFYCLPIYKCSSIFSETLQMLLMIPLLFCIIFPYVSYLLIVTCYILAVLVLIATSIAANAAMSITWNLSTILFFAIILYVYQRQHLQLFFYIQRYQGIVGARERDRRTRATKLAQETRNMIANISHDLKSPLAGIVCGIEMIRESCIQWRLSGSGSHSTTQLNHPNTSSSFHTQTSFLSQDSNREEEHRSINVDLMHTDENIIQMIDKSLQGMEASYYLMLMTINRSTQYTKTLHNISLLPTVETIDVKEVIYRSINIVSTLQYNAKVVFECYVRSQEDKDKSEGRYSVMLNTDKQWLLDNLLCLISNAVKYSKPQANCKVVLRRLVHTIKPFADRQHLVYYPPPHLKGDGKNVYDWITFEVFDEGPGLQPEDAEDLFQAPDFSEQRTVGGTGLGLYCLGKRIEILKGCYGIQLRDEADQKKGSVFWFALPNIDIPSSPKQQRASPLRASSIELQTIRVDEINQAVSAMRKLDSREESKSSPDRPPSTSSDFILPSSTWHPYLTPTLGLRSQQPPKEFHLRILLVDDALPILKMLRMMLENNGHYVVSASNGKEAMDIMYHDQDDSVPEEAVSRLVPATNPTFDVILMDLQMPIMDGFEAIRIIRSTEAQASPLIQPSRSEDALSNSSILTQDQFLQQSAVNIRRPFHQVPYSSSAHTIIIAMSANSDHGTMQRAYAAGADNFIAKPFNMEKFNDALQACWEGSSFFSSRG